MEVKKIKKQAILLTLTLILILFACNVVSAAATSNNSTTQLSTNNSTTATMNSAPSKVVISGKVLKCSDGTPFSGVTVTVSKGGTKLANTTTSSDGTYTLSFFSSDAVFNVTASYPGHFPSSQEVNVTSSSNNISYGSADFQLGTNTYYVDPVNGDNSNSGTSADDAFKTIEKAIKKINKNNPGYIYLESGTYAGTGNVDLTIDREITLVRDGSSSHPVIDAEGNSRIFNIEDGVTVTIVGVTLKNGHAYNSDQDNYNNSGGAIYNNGTLNLNYCTFTGNNAHYYGGVIYNKGLLNVNNSIFTTNLDYLYNMGIAIYNSGSCNVTGCTFANNTECQGVIATSGGNLNVVNCNFTNNTAVYSFGYGAAIYAESVSFVTVTGSNFANNHADAEGGAIYSKYSSLSVTNCTFTNNTALSGGAIYSNFAYYFSVINCTFTDNNATNGYGGAIYSNVTITPFIITGSNFTYNTVTGNGGAVYNNLAILNVTNCKFISNTGNYGGAICSDIVSYLSVIDSSFVSNNAIGGYGGAICSNNVTKTFNVTGSSFTNNTATIGGAIYSWNTNGFAVTNGIFTDNNATIGGAVYNDQYSTLNVTGSTFTGNRADNANANPGGGAIANIGTLTVEKSDFTNNSEINGDGGAIWNTGQSTITSCNFTGNAAESGAVWNTGGANCIILNCNFINNTATNYGAAIENYGNMTVNNSTFINDTSKNDGGAISNYGNSLTFTNCNFTGNTAKNNGGAIWNTDILTVTGSIFTNNTASGGGAIYTTSANTLINFNRIINNIGTDVYSSVTGVDATKNWWGDNFQGTNPQSANRVNSNVNANPWVILTIKASPAKIDLDGISTVTADFNHINGGGDLTGGHIPEGPITLNVPWGSLNSNGQSFTENTVDGVISLVTFNTNGETTVNPLYNPVKVTASADGYTTNEESAFITINTKANLSITKTGPSNVTAGNKIIYTITVINNGPNYAADVVVSDTLPANISNISWTAVYSGGATGSASGTGNLNLNLGILPKDGSCTITVTGTVLSSTAADTVLTNTATVSTSSTETDPTDNSAAVSTTVNAQSALNVVKEALSQVTAGMTYTDPIYRITVTNNGPSDARDVQVTDSIPSQIINREYRIDGGAWTSFTGDLNQLIEYIASGSSSVIEIRGKVLSSALAGTISNNASASVYGNTFNSTPVITNIVISTGIDLNETVNNSRPNAGDAVTFTVTVHNNGPSDALNVQIQDLMPSDFTNVNVTQSKGTYNNGIWTLNLTSGENATLTFTGVVSSAMVGKNTTNTASYGSNSTNATIYVPKSDLYIKITSSNNNPEVGEKFLITYKLGNYGPDGAENVTITFKLPEGLEFVKVTADTGNCTYDPATRTVTWTIGSVPVGDPYLYFTVKAAGDGTYKITPGIDSVTYNSGSSGVITINVHSPSNSDNSNSSGNDGSSTVNAASTISMQKTGVPLNYLILAIFLVLGGLVPKRK
jgi:conserved repeat domain